MFPGISLVSAGSRSQSQSPPTTTTFPLSAHTHIHTQDQALLNYLGKCEGGALFLHLRAVGTFTALFQRPPI